MCYDLLLFLGFRDKIFTRSDRIQKKRQDSCIWMRRIPSEIILLVSHPARAWETKETQGEDWRNSGSTVSEELERGTKRTFDRFLKKWTKVSLMSILWSLSMSRDCVRSPRLTTQGRNTKSKTNCTVLMFMTSNHIKTFRMAEYCSQLENDKTYCARFP